MAARSLFTSLDPPARRQAAWVFLPAAGLILACFLLILSGPAPEWVPVLDNIHWTVSYLGAALLAWIGFRAAAPEDRRPRGCFALGLLLSFLGQAAWDLQQFLGWDPFPSLADPLYLALGPCCAFGLWSSFRTHASREQRRSAPLDLAALVVTALSITLALYLPRQGEAGLLQLATLIAYPVAMLGATGVALVAMLILRPQPGGGCALFLLALGGTGVAWMEWNAEQLDGTLGDGTLLNAAFSVFTLALGCGAMLWHVTPSRNAAWIRFCERSLHFLPILLVIMAISAAFATRALPGLPFMVRLSVGLGAMTVILLAIIRQSFLLAERERLLASEHRMHENEERYKALFEAAQDAIFLMNRDGFVDCNPSTLRMFGCTRDQIVGKSPVDFSPAFQPDGTPSAEKMAEKIEAALAGKPQFFEWLHHRPDGTLFEAEVSLSRIDADGSGRLLAIVRDLTGRKQAEEALQVSEEQFTRAFEYAPIGKALVALDGRWLKVNRALCRMLGYSAEELMSKSFQELTHPDDLQADLDLVDDVLAGRIPTYDLEKRYFHKSGQTVTALLHVSLVRDARGAPLHFISQVLDITQRKQLEAQFLQAQKMEAVGRLSGGVAHDFNNILTIIQMQAAQLRASENFTVDQVESLRDIQKAAERAANLTRQLLAFSRRQPIHPVSLDLNEVVSNMNRMLDRIVGEDVEIKLRYAPGPALVHADTGMIEQILLNLVINARDAMPGGGVVTVGIDFAEFPGEAGAPERAGEFVRLSVGDTGPGIPPEILPRIFEPFFTTKEVGQGTGLGLATVHGIVQQHNGWVEARNQPGSGAVFEVHLPRTSAKEAPAQKKASVKPGGGTETVLVVEDEPSLRLIVRKTLNGLGYRVLEAATGREAVGLWKLHRDTIRLVFTDLVMPDGMTGADLGRALLRDNPGLKVIYTSGYSADAVDKDFPLQEGFNFLGKPYAPHKLAQTIRARLDEAAS